MILGLDFEHQIRRLQPARSGEIHRCSSCLWPATLLGPAIEWVDFSSLVFRGLIVDATSNGVLERLDHLRLCAECVMRACLLVDPAPAKTHRDKVEIEQKRLVDELTGVTRATTDTVSNIKRLEKQIAELEAARDRLEELRATVSGWGASWDRTAEEYRQARLRTWAWQFASEHGDDQAGAELPGERERFDESSRKLAAQRKAGVRLIGRCREASFADEAAVINEKLNTLHLEEK
jgi:hypothetical protein